MNIHLPAILMFTRGTRFWHTAIPPPWPIPSIGKSRAAEETDHWEVASCRSTCAEDVGKTPTEKTNFNKAPIVFSGSLALLDVWFELWHLFLVTWDWFWCQNCAYPNSKKTTFAWGLIDIIVPYGLTWLWNMAHVVRCVKRWWCSSSQMVPWFPHELIPNKNPIEYPAW